MDQRRAPRGYRGVGHQTLGSDILAVLGTVRSSEDVLGVTWHSQLKSLKADAWYPVATMLDLLSHLEKRSGRASLVKMGRQLFHDTHEKRVGAAASCAGDIVFGIDAMYHHANRGEDIGGWQVKRFSAGVAILEKTTPHDCAVEEGLLLEALHHVGTDALLVQTQCLRQGADSCIFELHSAVRDHRWFGTHGAVPSPG